MSIKQILLLISIIFMAACGNKGALYIPVAQDCTAVEDSGQAECKN